MFVRANLKLEYTETKMFLRFNFAKILTNYQMMAFDSAQAEGSEWHHEEQSRKIKS